MSEKYERLTSDDYVAGVLIGDLKTDVNCTQAYHRLWQYENSGLSTARVMELSKAQTEGRLVVLPIAVGNDIYFVDAVDCCECENRNECRHVGVQNTESCPKCIAEVLVESIECRVGALSADTELTINDLWTFAQQDWECIKRTLTEAEAALAEMEATHADV